MISIAAFRKSHVEHAVFLSVVFIITFLRSEAWTPSDPQVWVVAEAG
jgi:hypothetical protein